MQTNKEQAWNGNMIDLPHEMFLQPVSDHIVSRIDEEDRAPDDDPMPWRMCWDLMFAKHIYFIQILHTGEHHWVTIPTANLDMWMCLTACIWT